MIVRRPTGIQAMSSGWEPPARTEVYACDGGPITGEACSVRWWRWD